MLKMVFNFYEFSITYFNSYVKLKSEIHYLSYRKVFYKKTNKNMMNYDLSFCLKSTIKNLSILDKNRRKKSIKKSKNYEIVFKVFDIIFC